MQISRRPAAVHPYAVAVVVGVVFCIAAVVRWNFWTYGTDTGIFAQAILFAGDAFRNGPETGSHLRFHWSPIIAVLTPFLLLIRSPLVIEFAQVGLIVGCVVPVYRLLARSADVRIARFAGYLTLLYAPLAAIAFEEFHELAFLPLLVFLALDALDRRAWAAFSLAAVAALLVREDALLVTGVLGLCIAAMGLGILRPRLCASFIGDRTIAIAGIAWFCASALVLYLYFHVVIPLVGYWRPSHFYTYAFADGPGAVLLALLHDPRRITEFLTLGRFMYCLEAFVPLCFLCFRSVWLIPAIPGFAVILLSNSGFVWRMGGHYTALWLPFALLGTIDTVMRMDIRIARRFMRGIIGACVIVMIAFNPMHPVHYLKDAPYKREAEAALAIVPHDARVLVHDEWFSHHALEYPNATVYPQTPYDWAIVNAAGGNDEVRTVWRPQIAAQVASGEFIAVRSFGPVTVYRRNSLYNAQKETAPKTLR